MGDKWEKGAGAIDPGHDRHDPTPDMLNYAKMGRVSSRWTVMDSGCLSQLLILGLGVLCLVIWMFMSGNLGQ